MELDLLASSAPPAVICETSTSGFEADVIQRSMTVPVVVDFWAPWCGPCKQLMPALEKHVRASKGKVALAKVNIDQNPELAQALRIQSVPMVYAFWQGQPVDGFAGVQGEAALKAFFDKLAKLAGGQAGPEKKIAAVLSAGRKAFDEGDLQTATEAYVAVLDADAENVAAKAGLARCLIAGGDTETASEMLDDLGAEHANHADVLAARAALLLKSQNTAGGEIPVLEAQVASNPADFEKRLQLAMALAGNGRVEPAIDHLLDMYRLDRAWNDEAARKQLLVILESLGPGNPLATASRRRLSALMFA